MLRCSKMFMVFSRSLNRRVFAFARLAARHRARRAVAHREQERLLAPFGKLDWEHDYNYKRERGRR